MAFLLPLASSSSGNCYYLELGGLHILLDLGVSCRRLCAGLKTLGLTPEQLDAVFITHSHTDHTRGLAVACKRVTAPVFMTYGTAACCVLHDPECFRAGDRLALGGVRVQSFATPHDCAGSVGYVLQAGDVRVGFATDLGHVPAHIFDALAGAQTVVLESNHDPELLCSGSYPAATKRRILSPQGHLSNADSAAAAKELSARGTRRFLLAHLSRENNTPALALSAAQAALAGTDAEISVAPPELGQAIPL
ncbi:MAG: MBL fold metallo-hydrolase [Clostridiales bacterium]|nr:MBL fold metallo-hydrolase [Clostridiales bacterium]